MIAIQFSPKPLFWAKIPRLAPGNICSHSSVGRVWAWKSNNLGLNSNWDHCVFFNSYRGFGSVGAVVDVLWSPGRLCGTTLYCSVLVCTTQYWIILHSTSLCCTMFVYHSICLADSVSFFKCEYCLVDGTHGWHLWCFQPRLGHTVPTQTKQ